MSKSNKSQVKIGAVITYCAIAFNIIAGLLYTPWMVQQIGQSDYALYTLANSLISLFLVDFGLSTATTRFVAKYRAENNPDAIRTFLGAVYKLYLLLDVIVFAVLAVIYFNLNRIYVNLSLGEVDRLKVVFCITGLYSVISFPCVTFNGILNAYEQFIPLKLADLIQRVASVCLTVVALLLGGGLYWLVIAHTLSGILCLGIKLVFVRRNTSVSFTNANGKELYKDIFSISIWSTVWALAQRLVFNITPTIMGMVLTAASSAIAVFGIVATIEGYVYTITTAINGMFLSRITRIVMRDQDGEEITELATRVGRYQFAVNALLVLGFWFVGKEFIQMWIGDRYILAYYCILLVIVPGVFYNSLQIANSTMIAQNLVKFQAFVQIVMGVTNVALSLVFTRLWGVVGASLAICIAYTIRVILTLILIHKKLNIHLPEFLRNCYGKMSTPVLVTFVICGVLNPQLVAENWLMLCVKGAFVVAVYAVSLVLFGLYPSEREYITKRLGVRK